MRLPRKYFIPTLIFILITFGGWLGLQYVHDQDAQKLDIKTQIMAEQVGIRLQEFLNIRLTRLDFFRERMESSSPLVESEFRSKALVIQHELSGFQAINMINAKGIIEWVTPLSQNLPVIGANLIKKGAKGAAESFSRAILYGVDTATPPVDLIQGGKGMAIYLPIVIDGVQTGFINGVFRLEELISQCLGNTVRDFNYEVILSGERVFMRGEEQNFENPVVLGRHNFTLLGQSWELQVVPGAMDNTTARLMGLLSLAVIIIIALLLAFIARSQIISSTKLTEAYRIVEESEVKFRTIFDKSPACLIHFNEEWEFTNWNRAAAALFDFEFPVSTKRKFSDLEGLRPLESVINTVIEGKAAKYAGFIEISGRRVEVDTLIEPLSTDGEKKQGGIILLKDVTEQNQTLRAKDVMYEIGALTNQINDLPELFRAIQKRLSNILDSRNFYVALYDEKTKELSYPHYEDEFDSPPPAPTRDERGLSAYVLAGGVPVILTKQEILSLHKAGEIDLIGTPPEQWLGSPLMVKGKPIGIMAVQSYSKDIVYDGNDMGLLNFISDQIAITIKSKLEDEMLRESEAKHRKLSIELNDSNNIKALLLDIITHDLKNPAGVISSIVELISMEGELSDELTLIRDSSNALLKVIENATSLARITVGEKIAMDQLNLSQVAQKIAGEFESSFQAQGKPIEIKIEPTLLCQANPVIAEVFRNYLSNALKYAPDNKQVIFSLEDEGDMIGLYVADLGVTIESKNRIAIFERSVQLANGKSRGSGLGLAIVRRIAGVHNASVGVSPNEPSGNIFYMKLPKSDVSQSITNETERA